VASKKKSTRNCNVNIFGKKLKLNTRKLYFLFPNGETTKTCF